MDMDKAITELKRSVNEDKLPLNQMNVHFFYVVCHYLIPFEENVFKLNDTDLRVFLLLITEDLNANIFYK